MKILWRGFTILLSFLFCGITLSLLAGSFTNAFGQMNLPRAREIISSHRDPNIPDESGYTALMAASHTGETEMVDSLIARGADVNAKSNNGRTALMEAASQGWIDAVQSLMVAGADVNAADAEGWTPGMLALNNEHTPGLHGTEVAKMLRLWSKPPTDTAVLFIPDVVNLLYLDDVKLSSSPRIVFLSTGPHTIIVSYWKHGIAMNATGPTKGEPLKVEVIAVHGAIHALRYEVGALQDVWRARIDRYH